MEQHLLHLKQVTNDQAMGFLKANRADKEHIAISQADEWWAGIDPQTGEIFGTIGYLFNKTATRVKGLFVRPDQRGKGLGHSLVTKTLFDTASRDEDLKVNAFATDMSDPIFESIGLKVKRTNKNGIHFMGGLV